MNKRLSAEALAEIAADSCDDHTCKRLRCRAVQQLLASHRALEEELEEQASDIARLSHEVALLTAELRLQTARLIAAIEAPNAQV